MRASPASSAAPQSSFDTSAYRIQRNSSVMNNNNNNNNKIENDEDNDDDRPLFARFAAPIVTPVAAAAPVPPPRTPQRTKLAALPAVQQRGHTVFGPSTQVAPMQSFSRPRPAPPTTTTTTFAPAPSRWVVDDVVAWDPTDVGAVDAMEGIGSMVL
eukprot:PhM_4_TR15574/c0_g1_i1/m.3471